MKKSYFVYKTFISISLVIFCCTLFGLQQKAIAQSEKEMNDMVTKLSELWNKGNLTLADELFSPDVVRHAVDIYDDLVGIDANKEWIKNTRISYPDFNVKSEGVIIKDNWMVWRWTITGTNTGTVDESPPTGKKMQVSGVTISKVVNGKIAEQWFFWNHAAMLIQLGYTLTPPSTTKGK